jgi:6-phosphofructokinase 2
VSAIATITTNPAVDVASTAPAVEPTRKLRCEAPHVQAGGGGINVSRVVDRFGVATVAVFTAGGPNGLRLTGLVRADGLDARPVEIAQETRESFTITDGRNGDQYRFVFPGPALGPGEEEKVLDAVRALPSPAFVVHSGSLPPGVSEGFFAALADAAAACGARVVIDGPGEALARCRGAFLVKPNHVELEALVGHPVPERADRIAAARTVVERGIAENVLVSLGPDGALLITPEETFAYSSPDVELVSAVGAGDSMVGGLLAALARGESLAEAAAWGTAAGAAAILTPDTDLCRREDVERLRPEVGTTLIETADAAGGG